MTLSNRHLGVKSTFTVYKVRKVYQGLKVFKVLQVFQAPPPDIVEVIPVHPLPGDGLFQSLNLAVNVRCQQFAPVLVGLGLVEVFGAPGLLPGLHHFDDLTLAGGVLFVVIQSFITPLVYIILNAFLAWKDGQKVGPITLSPAPPLCLMQ